MLFYKKEKDYYTHNDYFMLLITKILNAQRNARGLYRGHRGSVAQLDSYSGNELFYFPRSEQKKARIRLPNMQCLQNKIVLQNVEENEVY